MSVKLIVRLKAKSGCDRVLKAKLEKLVVATLQEEGCLVYRLHVDNADNHHFIFIEEWQSHEALDKHKQSPQLVALMKDSEDYLDHFEVIELNAL